MLTILTYPLGIVRTNTYLAADTETHEAVVIDPAEEGKFLVLEAQKHGWHIDCIWLTHAHFDHIAGVAGIINNHHPTPSIAMHPADLPLWQLQGGAGLFGIKIDPGPKPDIHLQHNQQLNIGSYLFEVRHCPGHTPGHVIFYSSTEKVIFCGDVIFSGSIGRTDLPGGNIDTLLGSIRTQILTLPAETRLFPGHEGATTVGRESKFNPFLR